MAALRLSEKGYRVAVLEAGRRFDATNLPRTSWEIRRFLWAPTLGCYGIQRVHFLRDVLVLAGAGVGADLSITPILFTNRWRPFTTTPNGRPGPTGGRELRPYYDKPDGCSGWSTTPP